MIRKIKFRVWDHSNKEFVDDMSITTDGSLLCDGGNSGYYGDFTVQLSTGLKDAHNREVYDGDIFTYDIGLGPIYYYVFWDAENGQWKNNKEHGGNIGSWFDLYTVVGNIFENPELIKIEI